MKNCLIHRLLAFVLIVWSTPILSAQGRVGTPGGAIEPHRDEMGSGAGDMAALEQFLSLSDAQLDSLAQAIERVRSMSPTERGTLQERINAYRKLPAEEREQIRTGWASRKDWEDWRTMMSSLAPDERNAIQTRVQAMPFDDRATYKHELLEHWRAGIAPQQEKK